MNRVIKGFKEGMIFLCVFIFLSPFCIKAQEVKPLSLQQAIELSLKNSHQLKATLARNDQAAAELKQAMDNRLPNASISGSYLRLANPDISLKTKAFSGGSDTSGSTGGMPSVNQALYGIVNVSMPLYAGGKIRYGIESAKYLQEATLLDGDYNREEVILNTINAYVNLYKAGVTVNVVNENLLQSAHRDSVLSRLEQNGLLARNDLLKAELQTSNISLSLLDAKSNLEMANINMNLMLGFPESTILATDSLNFQKDFELKTIGEYEQMAFQNRKDILALAFRKKAATSGISSVKAELYPSIALTGGYVAADIPHFIAITNAVNMGIGIQYNLGSLWKAKAKISQAQAREKEIIANQAQLDDDVKLQVNQDFQNYLLSQKKIEVYKKAVMQAEENYRITKNKYDNALVNTTDLLDANVLLLQSKINLAVAKADVMLSYSKLLQATGTLSNNQ
ncbi:MAG: TolC family protein [Bacteroidota bacterium]|nr:TolC family protein [Bacteroidota bacterium]